MEGFIILILIAVAVYVIYNINSSSNKTKAAAITEAEGYSSIDKIALVFDVETTGLFKDNSIQATKKNVAAFPDNFPRIVQLAFMITGVEGAPMEPKTFYIKQPEPIPKASIKIHGITDEKCEKEGVSLKEALEQLWVEVEKVETVVAHNIPFDWKVIKAECIKNNLAFPLQGKNKEDTMFLAARQLGFPNGKYIKLITAGDKLFGNSKEFKEFKSGLNAHDAASDVMLTSVIYNTLALKYS